MKRIVVRKLSPKGILVKTLEDVNRSSSTNMQKSRAIFDFITFGITFVTDSELKEFIDGNPKYMKYLFNAHKNSGSSPRDIILDAVRFNEAGTMSIGHPLHDVHKIEHRAEAREDLGQASVVKLTKLYHWVLSKLFEKSVLKLDDEVEMPVDAVLPEAEGTENMEVVE